MRGGELFEHISERERLSEEEASAFLHQILQGVRHMHLNSIAHLDLKVSIAHLDLKVSVYLCILYMFF